MGTAAVGVPSGRAAARRGPDRGACTVGCSGRSRSSPRPGARARPRAPAGAAYGPCMNTLRRGMKSLTCPSCSGLRASAWSAMGG